MVFSSCASSQRSVANAISHMHGACNTGGERNLSCSLGNCFVWGCAVGQDPATPKSMYFNDVEAHEVAALYAKSFSQALNAGNGSSGGGFGGGSGSSNRKQYPPVSYVAAFIVEFVDKPGRPVCGCEQALAGTFRKYNNNVGAVCAIAPEDAGEVRARAAAASAAAAAASATGLLAPSIPPSLLDNWDPQSTAQAFSHYTFSQSHSQLLICDIQGVANRFTDPQIHTLSGKGFGLGNLGQTGIRAFLLRHTCTEMCRACGLSPVRAKDLNEKAVIPNFNNLPLHLNVNAVVGAGAGGGGASGGGGGMGTAGAGGGGSMQRRQASVDHSVRSSAAAASSSASAGAGAGARPAAAADRSYPPSASATPSASRSPSSSPRSRGPAPAPAPSLRSSPPLPSAPAAQPAAYARAPPPAKKPTLDDSDEALMASIMGD